MYSKGCAVLAMENLCPKIALKSVLLAAPAAAYLHHHGKGHSSTSLSLSSCIQPWRFQSTVSEKFSIPPQQQDSGSIAVIPESCSANSEVKWPQPLGKLRIDAPPKNPATIFIQNFEAHQKSGELLDSSVGQTR